MFDILVTSLPQIRNGKVRPLAVTSDKRSEYAPDIPTMRESGVPGYAASAWYGLFAPAGTPADVIQKLNKEITKILRAPDIQTRLVSMGAEAAPSTPEELGAFVREESEKWGKVLREIDITLD